MLRLVGVNVGKGRREDGVEPARVVAVARVRARREVAPQVEPVVVSVSVAAATIRDARAAAQDGVAVLVVPAALLRIGEHGVRSLYVLECLGSRGNLMLVLVRMPQQRQLAVALLELVVGRQALDAKHLVVAALRDGHGGGWLACSWRWPRPGTEPVRVTKDLRVRAPALVRVGHGGPRC